MVVGGVAQPASRSSRGWACEPNMHPYLRRSLVSLGEHMCREAQADRLPTCGYLSEYICCCRASARAARMGGNSRAPSTSSILTGCGLSSDAGLPEGDAQAPGLSGTPLCRGRGLARVTPVSPASAVAGEQRGIADCDWPEPQAPHRGAGLGPPTAAQWGSDGRHTVRLRSFAHLMLVVVLETYHGARQRDRESRRANIAA
jgi:hypothetical protein